MVIHPANPDLILGVVSAPGAGLLQSQDGGNSWNFLAQTHFEGQALLSITVHPTDTDILYVAAGWNGASKSTDGGATWKPMSALPSGDVFDLIVSQEGPDVLYAGVVCNTSKHPKNGIYKSADAGTSWQAVNTGLPPPQALTHTGAAIRLEPGGGSSDPVVYGAVLQNTAGRPFVWLSPGAFGDQQHFTCTDSAGTIWDTAYGGPFSAWSLRQINAGGLTDAPAAASPPVVCLFGCATACRLL